MSDKGRVWPGEITAGRDSQTDSPVWQITRHPSISHNLYFLGTEQMWITARYTDGTYWKVKFNVTVVSPGQGIPPDWNDGNGAIPAAGDDTAVMEEKGGRATYTYLAYCFIPMLIVLFTVLIALLYYIRVENKRVSKRRR